MKNIFKKNWFNNLIQFVCLVIIGLKIQELSFIQSLLISIPISVFALSNYIQGYWKGKDGK